MFDPSTTSRRFGAGLVHAANAAAAVAATLTTALVATLVAAAPAAAQVGVERSNWSGGEVPGLIWYPSPARASAEPQRWGPFEVRAIPGAPYGSGGEGSGARRPLVVISHGTGGTELGHVWLAQTLAAEGYIVATPRHPGDNYQDRSGVARPGYFEDRPRTVSRLLDELLADPRWAARIDAQRIAVIGHSAGGHTALALAGARADRSRVGRHCSSEGPGLREDAAMCRLGGFTLERPAPVPAPVSAAGAAVDVGDARVRALVLLAPLAIAFDAASLARVALPVHVEVSAGDEVLAPRFHADPVCAQVPRARCWRDAVAGHFAAFQAGTGPLPGPTGDPAADPAGFDRRAWQAQAGARISGFLAASLR